MRLYTIKCEQCGWEAPLAVTAEVADHFRGRECLSCMEAGRTPRVFTVTEHIIVGRVAYLPAQREPGHGD